MPLFLIVYVFLGLLPSEIHAECKYAFWGINSRPIKMDECGDLKWGSIIHSYSRHCYKHGGNVTYKLYYEENCPSDPSKWYEQETDTPCYIDESIEKCPSIAMEAYTMTYDKSISYEYFKPDIENDTDWEPNINPTQNCYYDSGGEYFSSHPIYDICLLNPISTEYQYVKGEYYNGAFETNCSYKVHYYSDHECKNKISTSYTYNEQCREGNDAIPYSFHFPDCPWRPNTVWVVVFCVLGCCFCGCCCWCLIYYLQRNTCDISCNCDCCSECHNYCKMKRDERRRRVRQQQLHRLQKIRELELQEKKKQEENEYDEIALQKLKNKKMREEQELKKKKSINSGVDKTEIVSANDIQNRSNNNNNNMNMYNDMIDRQRTLSYSAAQCVICLDVLLDNESVRLVCGHKFHTHCIEEYNETKTECPLCRKTIVYNHH